MKLKKTTACVLTAWLPGFEPAANDSELWLAPPEQRLEMEVTTPVRNLWPCLPLDLFKGLTGAVAKYEANMAAIKELEFDSPSRDVLTKFTGWGGLPQAFNKAHKETEWVRRAEELEAALQPEEYQSAFDSTPNAHYTTPEIVAEIWELVKRLGFDGGRVLDPSCGTGLFTGYMPTEIAKKSTVTMVELDAVTAKIATALYQPFGAKVINAGFEKTRLPPNHFDLVISNVPFGNYKVSEARNCPYQKFFIHDYFIAKSLDLVREGGLVVVITSSGTMDKRDSRVRQYFANEATLIGAIRLPSMAFKNIANTEVTTDVLIFQKGVSDIVKNTFDWESVEEPSFQPCFGRQRHSINSYFCNRRENVLGELEWASNGYTAATSVKFDGTIDELIEKFKVVAQRFPANIYQPRQATNTPMRVVDLSGQHKCGFHVINGVVHEVYGTTATILKAPVKTLERIKGMIEIRDIARQLVEAQMVSTDERTLDMYRFSLEMTYDQFVGQFGYLNMSANKAAFRSDPDFPLLLSLENWSEETNSSEKGDIFFRRTIGVEKTVDFCESVEDALTVCLSEKGAVSPDRIGQLVNKAPQEVMKDLSIKGLVYLNPENSEWEPADQYLSGNVRKKLMIAKVSDFSFQSNVEALQAVIPRDLSADEINARIGSTWIPAQDYIDFLCEVLESYPDNTDVVFNAKAGAWSVSCWSRSVISSQILGTSRCNATSLFEMALNQQEPTVTDVDPSDSSKRIVNKDETILAREKQSDLKARFVEWLWSDDARKERLVSHYNETMNCMVMRKYDGSHLKLPGYSSLYFRLRPHQLNAIWRTITSGANVLLGHDVGAGKTLTMICAGMELRRLGKVSKPLYVVPNHMLDQFATEFIKAYPAARILCASKDDLVGDKRRTLISKIRMNDWDAIIITHASFERIKLRYDFVKEFILKQMQQLTRAMNGENGRSSTRIVKELAKARKSWQTKLDALSNQNGKDDGLTFDELGCDQIFVDEAHLFKNLWRFTKMGRIAGLPNSNSARAFDMYLKCKHLQEKRPGSVVFATATFVSNSMAEFWVMQRFLQELTLENHEIEHFDAWAANFGESVTALELSPEGGSYRMNKRFARFVNLPELLGIFSEVADIQTKEMLKLPTPKVVRDVITSPNTDVLKAFVDSLVDRAEAIRSGKVSPQEDNMLAITGAGRKAALDFRLIDPHADDYSDSKLSKCAQNIYEVWKKTSLVKGTQLVFSDLGTPNKEGRFSAYHDLKCKLVDMGIPGYEVEFIHDHDSDAAKATLFKAVREGRVRILMGSTSKMGVGTNVQTRLVALHHLDAPWRPADVIQREGRIERQGNLNETVYIYRYVTQGSFDAYIWQTLETKARFIAQVLSGDLSVRSVEDVELAALSYAEVKALASGNPLVLEKAAVDTELTKLSLLKSKWRKQNQINHQEIARLPSWIQQCTQEQQNIQQDIAARERMQKVLKITLWNGKPCTTVEQGQQALALAMAGRLQEMKLGRVGEFGIFLLFSKFSSTWRIELSGPSGHRYEARQFGDSCQLIKAIRDGLTKIDSALSVAIEIVRDLEKKLSDLSCEVQKPFDKENRLAELIKRQLEIEAEFETAKSITSVPETEDQTEVSD